MTSTPVWARPWIMDRLAAPSVGAACFKGLAMTEAAATLTMAEAAEAIGRSPERFRKIWRRLRRDLAFPEPILSPADKANYAWDAEAVREWRDARGRCRTPIEPEPPANDARPMAPIPGVSPARLARERHQLAQLMKGA